MTAKGGAQNALAQQLAQMMGRPGRNLEFQLDSLEVDGKTYQMYKKEANEKLMEDLTAPRSYFMGIKLVRGAYLKQDQPLGVLCNTENETHHQYSIHVLDTICS